MTAVRMFHPSRASCSSAIKEKISRGEEVLNYDIENLRIEQKNSMLMSQSNAKTEVDGDICSSEVSEGVSSIINDKKFSSYDLDHINSL